MKLIFIYIAFPHFNNVLRADNQRFKKKVLFEYLGYCSCGNCFPKSDYITNHYTASFMQMMSGYQNSFLLKIQQFLLKYFWKFVFTYASASLTREMVSYFQIDMK